jgi:hypothetical protein
MTTATSLAPETRVEATLPVVVTLRLEGLVAGVLAVAAYAMLGASWWLFAALILAPDLAMLGYVRGPRSGAAVYNLAHTYVLPVVLGALGFGIHLPLLMAVAAIWVAHIGFDRAMGYGLKLGDFKATHLSLPTRR